MESVGSITQQATEADLRTNTLQNITISLLGDTWLGGIPSHDLIAGLVSGQSEPTGWNAIVRSALSQDHLHLQQNTTLAIYFRGDAAYDISAPETIAVEVPAAVVSSGQVPPTVTSFVIAAEPGEVSLAGGIEALLYGSLLNASDELTLVGPESRQLILRISGGTWAPGVGNDFRASRSLLAGIRSRQDGPSGWNAIVRDALQPRQLVRLSDSELLLVLPQSALFSIAAPETLEVDLLPSLTSSTTNFSSPGLITLQPRAGRAFISGGSLAARPEETSLRTSPQTIRLRLLGDTWREDLAPNATGGTNGSALTAELLAGFTSDRNESSGWLAVGGLSLLSKGTIARESATELLVTVPRLANYSITRPETLRMAVPASAVYSRVAPAVVLDAIVVLPEGGVATLESPGARSEAQIRAGVEWYGASLNISLEGDEWDPSLMRYEDVAYEVCYREVTPNATVLVNYSNLTLCNGSSNASNETNGSCAYAVNTTNASLPDTWEWGFPFRLPGRVDPYTGEPLGLPAELEGSLGIGGSSWRDALSFSSLLSRIGGGDGGLGRLWPGRRLGDGGGAWSNGTNVSGNGSNRTDGNGTNGSAVAGCVITYVNATCEERLGVGAAACELNASLADSLLNGSAYDTYNGSYNGSNQTLRFTNSCSVAPPPPPELCTTEVRRVYSDATRRLLRGVLSNQVEVSGWMRAVQPGLSGEMLRLNGSTLTVALPPQAGYGIDAPEQLSLRIPREALVSRRPLIANDTVAVAATGGRVFLSGLALPLEEESLRAPPALQMTFTLEDDKWDETLGQEGAASSSSLLQQGIYSEQHERSGWNAVVQPLLAARHISRLDDRTIIISIPATAEFEISQPETLRVVLPPSTVASRQAVAMPNMTVIMPTVGSVSLAGSLLEELGEGYLCDAPALTLELHLHGDTWEPNITEANSSLLAALADGISALTPRVVRLGSKLHFGNVTLGTNYSVQTYRYTGWDDIVRPSLQATQLNATALRLTIPPVPSYDIDVEDVVRIRLAPSLLRSRNPPEVAPHLRILPASAAAYGSLLGASANEYAIQNHSDPYRVPLDAPPLLVLLLRGDRWADDVASGGNATVQLLSSLVSSQNEPAGWNAIASAALTHEHVTRISDKAVHVALPRLPAYDITQPETISMAVPPACVRSAQLLPIPESFILMPTPGRAVLGGPPVNASTEIYLRDNVLNRTLTVTLLGDEWDPALGAPSAAYALPQDAPDPALAAALIGALRSEQSGSGGFNAVLEFNRSQFLLRVVSPSELQIELPQTPGYDILRPDTVGLEIPPRAVRSRGSVSVDPKWVILPSVGVPSVRSASGQLLTSLDELVIQVNGTELHVEIASDGFVEAVGQDSLISVNFIDALLSQQAEPSGWNAIIRRDLTYTALARSAGGSKVVLTLPPSPGYDVLTPETLGIHLPASVLLSGQSVLLEQTIGIVATAGTATASGSLALQGGGTAVVQPCCNREDYLQSASAEARTLVITLTNDAFVDGIEFGSDGVLDELLRNVASHQSEPRGWNAVVQQTLRAEHVTLSSTLTSRDTITFTLPVFPDYRVYAPETIVATVPPAAVLSRNTIVAAPRLLIRATPGVLMINGSLVDHPIESTLQNDGSTLLLTAIGDRWADAFQAPETGAGRAAQHALIQCLTSGVGNATSWNREVLPLALAFNASIVSLVGNETLELRLPRIEAYDVLLPEIIDVLLDPSLILSNSTLVLLNAFTIAPTPGYATLGGLASTNMSEFQLVVNRTIPDLKLEITVHADTWQPLVGIDVGASVLLLSGLRSIQSEPYGWNAIVLPGLASSNLVRKSETVLEVTLPLFAEYEISAPETLVLTIPVGSLTSNQSVVATPTIRIQPLPGAAFLTGPLLNATTERRLGAGQLVDFNVTLVNDTWVAGVGREDSAAHAQLTKDLIAAINPYGQWAPEVSGWEQVVRPALLGASPQPVYRASDVTIAVSIPAAPSYDIVAPETLALRIPWHLLTTEAAIVAAPEPVIIATPGFASVEGTLVCHDGFYSTFDTPPPPPPVIQEPALLPPPPSLPPTPPPAPPGFREPNACNNTEEQLSGVSRSSVVKLRLTNDSYIPSLLESRYSDGGPLDSLLKGLRATSWLHGSKNVSVLWPEPRWRRHAAPPLPCQLPRQAMLRAPTGGFQTPQTPPPRQPRSHVQGR